MGEPAHATRVLVLDCRDSFVHVLVGYLRELGADVVVRVADEIDEREVPAALEGFDGILLSPGPGSPDDARVPLRVVAHAVDAALPVLGVCLGHQVIAHAFGARVAGAAALVHGAATPVHHDGAGLFAGAANPLAAGRYHSLAVSERGLPPELEVTARTADGTVMALRHRSAPIVSVQFHPESVLTEDGYLLLGNWLEGIGLSGATSAGARLAPHRARLSPSTR